MIELLIVMIIGILVTAVAFTLWRLNTTYYLSGQTLLEMTQDLKVGLATLSRQTRMAGNGFSIMGADHRLLEFYSPTMELLDSGRSNISKTSGWFKLPDATTSQMGVRAIFGVDGGADNPDTLTVFSSEFEISSPLGSVTSFSSGDIVLSAAPPDDSIDSGDILVLVSRTQAVVLQAGTVSKGSERIPIKVNGKFTNQGPPSSFNVAGSTLFNLRDVSIVTYYIDEVNNRLMADYHDQTLTHFDDAQKGTFAVANNIEDLQLFYFFDSDIINLNNTANDPAISSSRLANDRVKAVSIALSARSTYPQGPKTQRRPSLFNRQVSSSTDNFRRLSLSETVFVRNFVK